MTAKENANKELTMVTFFVSNQMLSATIMIDNGSISQNTRLPKYSI